MKKLLWILLILPIIVLVACTATDRVPQDGQYTVSVALSGGSGRAGISSPAEVTLTNGKMTVKIVWSSPNYDLMLVNGEQYLPLNTEGNSTFEIPIASLDQDIAISAETTAMSQPHMIDYTISFDAATFKAAGAGQTAWSIIAAASTLTVAAIVLVVIRKNNRKRNIGHEA